MIIYGRAQVELIILVRMATAYPPNRSGKRNGKAGAAMIVVGPMHLHYGCPWQATVAPAVDRPPMSIPADHIGQVPFPVLTP